MLCSLMTRGGSGGRAALVLIGLLCAPSAALADDAGRKYKADFERGLPEDMHAVWSDTAISKAPGGRSFLGPFTNKTVTLTLSELPAHRMAELRFDLYVIGPWDGLSNPRVIGASGDAFTCRIVDGEILLYSTFAVPRPGAVLRQSYPREITGFRGASPAGTGASEIGSLGYEFADEPMDAVFPMSFRFAHTQDSITIEFGGAGLDAGTEQWGIDNVEVVLVDDENPTGEPSDLITEDTFDGLVEPNAPEYGYGSGGGGVGTNPIVHTPGGSNTPLMPNGGGGGGNNTILPPSDPPADLDENDTDITDEDDPDTDDEVDPPVPTPGTMMLAVGAGLLIARRRR